MSNSATPQKQGDHTVLWWIGWIALTILSFFVSYAFWTPFIAKHVGAMDNPAMPIIWVSAVFGSWMVLLVPLIIVMYNKVDRAYEDGRNRRESIGQEKMFLASGVKSVLIPEAERLLEESLVKKIKKMPQTIKRGHLVSVLLKNDKKIDHVFVLDKNELMGVYGYSQAPFCAKDIVDVLPADLDHLPAFETDQWLRFDGAGKIS